MGSIAGGGFATIAAWFIDYLLKYKRLKLSGKHRQDRFQDGIRVC
jgi:hypothetical protein